MVVVPGLMACALVYWVYANRLVDLAMVSLAGLTALCLITIGLFPFMESEAALLFVIIVLLALTGLFLPRLGVLMRLRVPDAMARSEEHTSELQSLMRNSYAVFCLKQKINQNSSDSIHLSNNK